jgi:hypothetical protein
MKTMVETNHGNNFLTRRPFIEKRIGLRTGGHRA